MLFWVFWGKAEVGVASGHWLKKEGELALSLGRHQEQHKSYRLRGEATRYREPPLVGRQLLCLSYAKVVAISVTYSSVVSSHASLCGQKR